MKKFLAAVALCVACVLAASVPGNANDGIIIHMKPTPTPTPAPGDDGAGRGVTATGENQIPDFWEFLSYFGL